jgi:carbon storage regulator
VTVVRVVGDKVRLGIEAPPHVLVLRDELEPRVPDAPPEGEQA